MLTAPVLVLATLFPGQFPEKVLGKTLEDGQSTWLPDSHAGDRDGTARPSLATVAICGEPMDKRALLRLLSALRTPGRGLIAPPHT